MFNKKPFMLLISCFSLLLAATVTASAEDAAKPKNVGYNGAFFIQSDDGNYKLKFNANMQLRYEYQKVEGGKDVNGFLFPRTRLIFTGNTFTPKLTYMFMPEMGDYDQTYNLGTAGATSLTNHSAAMYLRDLWFNYKFAEQFQIKFGQFFLPRTRQATTIGTQQQFGEYPITALSDFTFTWDRGVNVHGSISKFDYDVTLTNGAGGNIANTNRGMDIGTRLVYNIFGDYGYYESDVDYSKTPNLAVGGHISYNNGDNFNKASTAPGGTRPDYLLASGDVALKYKGFSLEAEFMDLHNYAAGATDVNNPAFTVQAGYFLIPKHWEIALQASQIYWDGPDNDWSEYIVGTSYFFKGRKAKIQATYSLLKYDGGSGNPPALSASFAGGESQGNHRFRLLFGFAF